MGAGRRLSRHVVRELWSAARGQRACYRVAGDSMSPCLVDGDLVWVETRVDGLPSPGEVVVVRDPCSPARVLIKRTRSRGEATFSVGSDDPASGRDSRHFGSLSVDQLIGRALAAWSPSVGLRLLGRRVCAGR